MMMSGCFRVLEGRHEVKERGLLDKRRDIWTVHRCGVFLISSRCLLTWPDQWDNRVKQDLKRFFPVTLLYIIPALPSMILGPLTRLAPNILPSIFLDSHSMVRLSFFPFGFIV